jgi:hypothetical protein
MKKKFIIASLATFAILASVAFKLDATSAEDTVKENEVISVLDTDLDTELPLDFVEVSPEAEEMLEEVLSLTQEEYDDLVRRLPEGAVLVDDGKRFSEVDASK